MPFLIRVPAIMARRLCALTLLYLALPLLIFFLGWLRPLWGLPAALLLLTSLGILVQRGWRPFGGEDAPSPEEKKAFVKTLLWTWIPVALMALQIGAGGFGAATPDWDNKHNLIFADLVRFPWPVVYRETGTPASGLMLVYYIGYYLPPAAFGKVAGWEAANIAWQLWTQLGFLLLCCWLVVFVGPRVRWLGVLFLCFAGAEVLGVLLHNIEVITHIAPVTDRANWSIHDIARWNMNASQTYYVLYRSNIVHLFWTPQHLLAGWFGIALVLYRWGSTLESLRPGNRWDGGWGGSALLGWSLLVFWSPLSALGVLPFLLALGVCELRVRSAKPIDASRGVQSSSPLQSGVMVLSSLLCVGVVALYLAVRTAPPADAAPLRGEHLQFLLSQLWREEGWHALLRYSLFVLVEFVLMYALVWPRRSEEEFRAWRAPLAVGFVVLMVLPCFIYGFYNDLAMRASIPAMALLCLFIAIFLQNRKASLVRRIGVVVLLFLGSSTIYGYTYVSVRTLYRGGWHTQRPLTAFRTIAAEYRNDPRHLITQYTGPLDSPFARFLAK